MLPVNLSLRLRVASSLAVNTVTYLQVNISISFGEIEMLTVI